jgi:WD40 repeat protein
MRAWLPYPHIGTPGAARTAHSASVTALAFDGDGRTLASASEDKTVKLWDPDVAKERTHFELPMRPILSLAFRRDGKLLVGVSSEGELEFWNVP